MRRLVVLVAMLVPLSLFAAGCGGGAGSSPSSMSDAEKAEKHKQAQKEMMAKMQSKMKGGMMSKQGKGAEVPDKTPTPQ